jgi:hypothetical protein
MVSISTMTNRTSPEGLSMEYQPNPLVTSREYEIWNQETQPRMNVNEGATVWCKTNQLLTEMSPSMNQKLSGLADPKTLVQPMISIPIYDNTVWKSNDFMVPMGINDQRRQELWQNGYLIDDTDSMARNRVHVNDVREDYDPSYSTDAQRCMASSDLSHRSLYPNNASQPGPVWNHHAGRYQYSDSTSGAGPPVETPFGYYPENLVHDLPTNYPAGSCQKQSDLTAYNDNIFTTTIQPGVYSKSQVTQQDSVMSNLGISYTQPFLPTYSSHVKRRDAVPGDEGVLYTQYDPNFAPQVQCTVPDTGVRMEDVYDPRFNGYGTEYRGYVDHLTGRPRFFYDDVDVHRRNQFITRNKIDFEPFGLQTGPQETPKYTNMQIREMAQNSFLDNALSFRTDLQQRLMQKSNNRAWQQKQAPISTNQFTRGGSSKAAGLTSTGYAGPRG